MSPSLTETPPQTAADTHALIVERFGPYVFHGTTATDDQVRSRLTQGLLPQNSDWIWVGNAEVAAAYAFDTTTRPHRSVPAQFRIDLRLIAPERLRADEQLGFLMHYDLLAAANPNESDDPDDEEDWRSYAETGNFAIVGAIDPAALALAD